MNMDVARYVVTHFRVVWQLINQSRRLRRWISKWAINSAISRGPMRPHPLSLMSDYTSWDSLTDRSYTGRHIPPRAQIGLPPVSDVADLFEYLPDGWRESKRSSLLFSYFAQWFTDGFLRTDRMNPRRNTSNHEVDLSPLYGLNRQQTNLLRTGAGGLLASQFIKGEEYPPFLFDCGNLKKKYVGLDMLVPNWLPQDQRSYLFAMGGDRSNVQIGYTMFNVLFLREHNRICLDLAQENPKWDDERLFQTARNVLIVTLLKLVVEEYINHIQGSHFKLTVDPTSFTNEPWYRTNWMTVEFNLLYRWHSLTPPEIQYGGQPKPVKETMFNNALIVNRGLGDLFHEASSQPAGEIGLHNTSPFLVQKAEIPSIKQARGAGLDSYNAYREMCQLPRVTRFDQITKDEDVQCELSKLYRGDVNKVEFYPGLFAEDQGFNSVLPELMGRMVAFDAFSQALTNPLMSARVFNESTFSPAGMETIKTTESISQILHRNVPNANTNYRVSLTRLDQ